MKERSKGTDYKCSQIFGYKDINEKINEQDLISYLKFDQLGRYLALGDKAGRIIIFKSNESKKKDEYFSYYSQFQAYNRQFDPLNSTDINEEILGISWMRAQGQYQKMLTMNSKFIKIWKIFEKPQKKIIRSVCKEFIFPKFQIIENVVNASLQKTFPNKHEQELISMQQTKNQQYILSTDPVKTVMWNIEKSTIPYLVADLQKDMNIQDVKQSINCLRVHPSSDSLFAYGTNRGSIVLSDSRISPSYKPPTFKMESNNEQSNFFTQMISSYSSLVFLNNNKQIAARDFLSVKVWDLAKTDKPIFSLPIQKAMKSKLCEIFENDSIFDKFNISSSKDSHTLLTGSYSNCFHAIDVNDSTNSQYQINYKKKTIMKPIIPSKLTPINKIDYSSKIVAADFNPMMNLFVVGSLNCFLIYSM